MKYSLIFIVIFSIFFSSCNNNANRVKTKYYLNTLRIVDPSIKLDTTYRDAESNTTYFYNDNGDMSSYTSSDGSKTSWAKNDSKKISVTTDAKGNVISTTTDFLNDKGQKDSSFTIQKGKITQARKYTYNQQGNIIEDRDYDNQNIWHELRLMVTWKFNYQDGNVVSEDAKFVNSIDMITTVNPKTLKLDTVIQKVETPETTIYYTYFMDKLNTTHGMSNSKNLIQRSVELASPKDTSAIKNYRYTFDDKGRIVTEVMENDPRFKDGASTEYVYDSSAYTYY